MNNYKMTLQYDGTRYNGWQRQENTNQTIQGILEEILSNFFSTKIEIQGSGRTDAGVHAYGQVANFLLPLPCDESKLCFKLNQKLPDDIKVILVEAVNLNFHSRFSVKSKHYLYRMSEGKASVFEHKYVHQTQQQLDRNKIEEAIQLLVGKHDFFGFSSTKDENKESIRTLYKIDIIEKEREVQFLFHGDGFLYNMVRILTGTLIEIGLGERELSSISKVFATRNREFAGKTAPAKGLFLYDVIYE